MNSMPWPPELDALIAAPQHHVLLMENEHVRVLETIVHPGETVNVHTHQWAAVAYIVSPSEFVRRDEFGEVLLDSRLTPGQVSVGRTIWSPSLGPHTFENVGDQTFHVITVEVKASG